MTSPLSFHLTHSHTPHPSSCPNKPPPNSFHPFGFLRQSYCNSFWGMHNPQIITSQYMKNSGGFQPICSKTQAEHIDEVPQNNMSSLEWLETLKDDKDKEALHQASVETKIWKHIKVVKLMLDSMEDGEVCISPYDTAWVALVKNVEDGNGPQFPSCLEWIANNQLSDGSWGDSEIFVAYDRIVNTLACVIALRSWNMHPDKCEKGMAFFMENLHKIRDENAEHMTVGFEVAFPSLLEIARCLNIEVPDNSPTLKDIFAKRDQKLTKIPIELMHKVPTTLLHSLEGMSNLDWKQLIKLQSQDGSFLFSPSSTAFAFIQTKDQNALEYLDRTVKRFSGSGVPNTYPMDIYEHLWVVDRLERLGVSRYFQQEIKDCLSYVSRYWTEKGVGWARNSEVQDLDDTSMGFRLLRLHGFQISPSVLKHFEKNGEFFCMAGQASQGVSETFNLYRASQVLFQGEKILEDAKNFSAKFLSEKRAAHKLVDKWFITKDLPGEIGYALDVPWYASFPRLETRFYVEQYGGDSDAWIGKSLYRMPYVCNDIFLELAKLDYNHCQAIHCAEWEEIQRWYLESGLGRFGLSKESLLFAYYIAAANIFEPERLSLVRLAWVKTSAMLHTLASFIQDQESRTAFVDRFNNIIHGQSRSNKLLNKREEELLRILLMNLDNLAFEMFRCHGQEISHYLNRIWEGWLSSWKSEGNRSQKEAELLVQIINLMAGLWSEELELNPQYQKLLQVTNKVCHDLYEYQSNKAQDNGSGNLSETMMTTAEIESEMQQLVELVFQHSSNSIPFNIKINSFFLVAKSFYYAACCDPDTINSHIDKVLFQKVM